MPDIKLDGYDESKSSHTEDRWKICFKLSAIPDTAWIQRINDLTRNEDVRIYGRVEVMPRQKLLCTEADGGHTAEQIQKAIEELLEEVNKKDDAMAQLKNLKF